MQARKYNPAVLGGRNANRPGESRITYATVDSVEFKTGMGSGMPGAIVYLMLGRDHLRRFARACAHLHIVFHDHGRTEAGPWDEFGLPAPIDGVDAWEVYGGENEKGENALQRLLTLSSVKSWHPIATVASPRVGAGSMPKGTRRKN